MGKREELARAIMAADPASIGFAERAVSAVLDALMKPTPEMIEAASIVEHPAYRDFAICVTGEWQAMLTTIKEGK